MQSWMRRLAWASLASQILIVVTGAAVRLTGSGLGCPTWPKCTEDSLITVPEMGIHGIIEFANRLLTFVLAAIAIATFFVARKFRERFGRKVLAPSIALVLGIVAQALIGGVTVLTGLNSWIVGLHFIVSAILIAIASVLVYRVYSPAPTAISYPAFLLTWPILIFGAISILIGVVVTGAGPHAGDAETPRNGLDLELWQHLHSYPAYVLALSLGVALFSQLRMERSQRKSLPTRILIGTFAVTVAQAIIGIAQARLGVPAELVALHMLGASILCSLLTFVALTFRAKVK